MLDINAGDFLIRRLHTFVKGWAAGNLYLFGEARADQALMAEAVTQGNDVLGWLDSDPALNLKQEYWAMSSGTVLWGVANSVFRDDPVLGTTWLGTNAPHLQLWTEWYNGPGFDWDSSWNVAYANAHFAVWDILGDPTYYDNGVTITDRLLSYDTDDDGGILAESQDPNTEDMTWVTSYLMKFGVDRLMGTPALHDVGALKFDGLADGDAFLLGEPITIRVLPTNYGLSDETGVALHLTGDQTALTTIDLAFAALDSVTLVPAWTPPAAGTYTLTAYTVLAGDSQASNDSVTVQIQVNGSTGLAEGLEAPSASPLGLVVRANPFLERATLDFQLDRRSAVELLVFDVSGRLVDKLATPALAPGRHAVQWPSSNRPSPSRGVYYFRLQAGTGSAAGKLVKLD